MTDRKLHIRESGTGHIVVKWTTSRSNLAVFAPDKDQDQKLFDFVDQLREEEKAAGRDEHFLVEDTRPNDPPRWKQLAKLREELGR